jgi:uncharacterized membrane protein
MLGTFFCTVFNISRQVHRKEGWVLMGHMMFYGIGGLLMTLFWAVVVVGGGYLIYKLLGSQQKETEDSAMVILRERYARRELTEDEYNRKIEMLRK